MPGELAKDMKVSVDDFYARLNPLRQKLFENRENRVKPFVNKIAITAWSGQMIAGFAAAGMALDEPKYGATAKKAAEFLLKHQALSTKAGAAAPTEPSPARRRGLRCWHISKIMPIWSTDC